jgi:hypothetical protein
VEKIKKAMAKQNEKAKKYNEAHKKPFEPL